MSGEHSSIALNRPLVVYPHSVSVASRMSSVWRDMRSAIAHDDWLRENVTLQIWTVRKTCMKRLFLLCVFVLLLPATANAATPKPGSVPSRQEPDLFLMRVGGFLGSSYSAELKDRRVIYRKTGQGKLLVEKSISVPTGQWQKFWKVVNEIQLEKWARRYDNQAVADGTQWHISIRVNGRTYESGGSNNYPADSNPSIGNRSPERSKRFNRLVKAVRELLGGVEFF